MNTNQPQLHFPINGWIVFWFVLSCILDYFIVKGVWKLCELLF